jgi:hypothetical protein
MGAKTGQRSEPNPVGRTGFRESANFQGNEPDRDCAPFASILP